MFLLLLLLINNKTIEARYTAQPPEIDGIIEDLWSNADSAYDFVQYTPYEKVPATEATVVYILYDDNNLYVAFRCVTPGRLPVYQLGGKEDNVVLYIDPMNSKTTAYYFQTKASGSYSDGIIMDDGRTSDESWDGVWYQASKIYEDKFEIEMQIPFKSIRYKKGINEWGINFRRYIAPKQEIDTWIGYSQKQGFMISTFSTLYGIVPKASGYYFEIYPEGIIRYEVISDTSTLKPDLSLNLKWDLTPQTTLNATINPDYAQIEADPYTLNLSRYSLRLSEQRPFFIEGNEIFHMSEGTAYPLEIYYSRKIGKAINRNVVPIIGGMKLSSRSKNWQFGILGAWTDKIIEDSNEIEPQRGFGVFRLKHPFSTNSEVGILVSSAASSKEDYNYAFGFDGALRSGTNQFNIQAALSDKNHKKGYALSSGFKGYIKDFYISSSMQIISDSFDVNDIGYVPWPGLKRFKTDFGLYKIYSKGFMKTLYIGPGICINQEPGDSINWGKSISFDINPEFRNNWGINSSIDAGFAYEADTNYIKRTVNILVYGNGTKYSIHFGGSIDYTYNYLRNWLGYQSYNYFWCEYDIISRVSLSLYNRLWWEFNPNNELYAVTPTMIPRIEFQATKDINLSIYSQLVFLWLNEENNKLNIQSNRIGLLFSWNFRPKSWIYIAFNDYREDVDGQFQLTEQLSAIKIKYLLYF